MEFRGVSVAVLCSIMSSQCVRVCLSIGVAWKVFCQCVVRVLIIPMWSVCMLPWSSSMAPMPVVLPG